VVNQDPTVSPCRWYHFLRVLTFYPKLNEPSKTVKDRARFFEHAISLVTDTPPSDPVYHHVLRYGYIPSPSNGSVHAVPLFVIERSER
jgi:hypothetical protein